MTATKTSKRLSSRCHVEKYSQVRVKRFEVWANWKIHLGAITSLHSEVVAQTAN